MRCCPCIISTFTVTTYWSDRGTCSINAFWCDCWWGVFSLPTI